MPELVSGAAAVWSRSGAGGAIPAKQASAPPPAEPCSGVSRQVWRRKAPAQACAHRLQAELSQRSVPHPQSPCN